jgi:hypothetical protein
MQAVPNCAFRIRLCNLPNQKRSSMVYTLLRPCAGQWPMAGILSLPSYHVNNFFLLKVDFCTEIYDTSDIKLKRAFVNVLLVYTLINDNVFVVLGRSSHAYKILFSTAKCSRILFIFQKKIPRLPILF